MSLDLGQFLENIAGIATWTYGPVSWDESLANIVRAGVADGSRLDRVLAAKAEATTLQTADVSAATLGNWKGDLTDFQLRDVERMKRMGHAANFSVPGAGKTRSALALYSLLKAENSVRSVVVVAPKSAHDSWAHELEEVFTIPPAFSIASSATPAFREVTVVNYERLSSAQNSIASHLRANPTLLVLDEAHRMKRGPNGIHGAACLSLGPLAAHRLILSGTPAPNGVEDLQSLLEFVWPGRGRRLVSSRTTSGKKTDLRSIFARTTKSELKLPKLSVRIERVTLPPLHRRIYDALLGRFSQELTESERVDDLGRIVVYLLMAATSPALLAVGSSRFEALQFRVPPLPLPPDDRVRSLLAELPAHEMSPKILAAIRIVRTNAALGKKTLLWSTFLRNIATLQELLAGLNPAVVTGQQSDEDRAYAIDRFREDPDCHVLISNPATLGEGISLHRECHEAVYIDRDFAAGRFLQSLDRIHRLGLPADTVTNITVLVSDSTIDDLVASRLGEKIRFMDEILDDPSLRELIDLEENRESGGVMDDTDVASLQEHIVNSSSI